MDAKFEFSLRNLCVLCAFLETRSSGCVGNQLKAKGLSLSFQMIDAALFVPLFISLLTDFNVTCALGQHRIKNARYFVRRGSDGLLATGACFDPTVERAQRCLAAVQTSGSHAKRLGCSIGIALGFVIQHLPA